MLLALTQHTILVNYIHYFPNQPPNSSLSLQYSKRFWRLNELDERENWN